MKKNLVLISFSLFCIILLIGCSAPADPSPSAPEEAADGSAGAVVEDTAEQDQDMEEAVPTEPPAATAEPVAEVVTEDESEASDGADASESEDDNPASDGFPATTVEEALIERANDQVIGAEDPLLTIIEYGDFQ